MSKHYLKDGVNASVVEFQSFINNKHTYIVKELSVVSLNKRTYTNAHFEPPYKMNKLNTDCQRTNAWLMENYHKLSWENGTITYTRDTIYDICNAYTPQIIFTKGSEKAMFLRTLFRTSKTKGDIKVIDLDSLNPTAPDFSTPNTVCSISEHKDKVDVHCALRTALHYAKWIDESEQSKDYHRENDRLDSFKQLNVNNPLWANAELRATLAANGFYYNVNEVHPKVDTENECNITCIWCDTFFVAEKDALDMDYIHKLHGNYSPNCPSLVGFVPNVNLNLESIIPR